jgi:Uma2 family endonuclease
MATQVFPKIRGYQPRAGDMKLPPLENGDHLSREEFERRYEAMPEHIKAELINGVVYMSSPVRYKKHGIPHSKMQGCLFSYAVATPNVELSDKVSLRLKTNGNDPQPDLVLRINEACGGRSRVGKDDYLEGAPELIVEIAASSASYDLHEKLEIYERNGVQEYLVWRIDDKAIDWFRLRGGKYAKMKADAQGIIKSKVFPGLWLNVKALLSDDLATVLGNLQQGIATAEHGAFVQRLAKRKK